MPTTDEKLTTLFPAGLVQITISGSVFTTSRIAGTPSKLLPPLRDLCINPIVQLASGEWNPVITIEIDTQHKRTIGVIKSYSKAGRDEALYLTIERESAMHPGEQRTSTEHVKFESILAFRLLRVEIPELALRAARRDNL